MPAAARTAVALATALALAFLSIAWQRRDNWNDLATFLGLGVMVANVAWCLVRREQWAWQVSCWVSLIATSSFGLLGLFTGVLLAAQLLGFDQGFLIATPFQVIFWAVWMLLLVVLPAGIGYALTRPPVRAWFADAPPG